MPEPVVSTVSEGSVEAAGPASAGVTPVQPVHRAAADKDWSAADPGADLRLVGGAGTLRRLLRPAVLETQRSATGRVLDLRGPLAGGFAYDSAEELVVRPATAPGGRSDEQFDTICSFGALAAARRLEEFVASLRPLVAPGGRLLFVELDGDARRWRRRLDRIARRFWGASMAGDISGALWAGGFELTSLDRRPLRTRGPGLLRVVVGAARLDPHRSGGPPQHGTGDAAL